MARKARQEAGVELTKSKQEWIKSAFYLGAESFEVAGALFQEAAQQQLTEGTVKRKLNTYRGGV